MKKILLVLLLLPTVSFAASWKVGYSENASLSGAEIFLTENGGATANNWVSLDRIKVWLDIPTNNNQLINGAGYLLTESDPDYAAWNKDYNDLINKPTIPFAINDLTDVDTTGKATGRILEFNSSGNIVVGDKGSGTVTVVQTTDGGSTTSVPSQAAVGTSLGTKVDLTNGGLLIDDLTKIKIKTTAEPVNGEPLVDATPSEKTKQTYTAAQTDTLVEAKADSSDLANQSAFESAFFTLPAGSFAFDTYPQYEDSAHSSGIAVNADTLAVYSSTSSRWLTVSLADTLSPAPTTYSLTVDMIDGNGTDKFTYSSTDYTTDQTFSGLSADATFTVTADTGRTVSCTGAGLTDNTGGSYTANTDSESVTAACTYSIAANECSGFAVCQNLEGTGYDNSEAGIWTEYLGGGTGTVDEDNTANSLRGGQSLFMDYSSYHANGAKVSFTGASELWGHFRMKMVDVQTGDDRFFRLFDASDTTELAFIIFSNQPKLKGAQVGGSTAYGGTTYSGATLYHVWWYYKAETSEGAADGVFTVWVGTTSTRPASSELSNTNGPQISAPGYMYLQSADGNVTLNAAYSFDQILIKTSEFTTVEE